MTRRYIFFKIDVLYYFFFRWLLSWCLARSGRRCDSLLWSVQKTKKRRTLIRSVSALCFLRFFEGGAVASSKRALCSGFAKQGLLQEGSSWPDGLRLLSLGKGEYKVHTTYLSNSSCLRPRSALAPPDAWPFWNVPLLVIAARLRATLLWARILQAKQRQIQFKCDKATSSESA